MRPRPGKLSRGSSGQPEMIVRFCLLRIEGYARFKSSRARSNWRKGSSRWPRSGGRKSAFVGIIARPRVQVSTASFSCRPALAPARVSKQFDVFRIFSERRLGGGHNALSSGRDWSFCLSGEGYFRVRTGRFCCFGRGRAAAVIATMIIAWRLLFHRCQYT